MDRASLAKNSAHGAARPALGYDVTAGPLPSTAHHPQLQYSPLGRQRSLMPLSGSGSGGGGGGGSGSGSSSVSRSATTAATLAAGRRPAKVFRYDCDYPVFAGDWGLANHVALSTFNENLANYIYVLHAQPTYEFAYLAAAKVTMPQTKVAWSPHGEPRVLSSGDALRMWQLDAAGGALAAAASMVKHSKSQPAAAPAPLTSFDWNAVDANVAIVSSIDTTCTVWDLGCQTVTTQLIAHDQEVFDVAFLPGSRDQFVSVGCDGSARLFDLRALDNSTIIYEAPGATPLLRVAPSPGDPNIVAAFGQEQQGVALLDVRATRNPVKVLEGHQGALNSMRWLPGSAGLLATGADDCQVLLWDVARGAVVGCANEIQQVNAVLASPDGAWLGSVSGKSLQAICTQMA